MWNSFVILKAGGIGPFEVFLLICTFFGAVSPTVDLWTIIIGLCVMMFGNAEKSIYPYFDERSPLPELHSRTALTIYMRNEEPDSIFSRLLAMYESLSQTGCLGNFRFVLLSDTSDPDVMRMEERTFERLKGKLSTGTFGTAFYRRRSKNIGFKAGNAFDYVEHHSDGDDFFVPLDSDSTMSGELLVRLASSMEKHPQIGMIQTQFATTPSVSGFSRVMYFFSAHIQNTGLSWWYKDSAIYWGHNAIIRTQAFLENCKLPVLKERAPLGGFILSHDIIESLFMRRAGYEVRLLPVETGSYEAHPPTFIDHMRRELRWCRGTIQYIVLLRQPGLKFISRIQICQVLASHLGPTVWTVMTLATIIKSTLVHSDARNINDLGAYSQLLQINMNAFPRIVSIVWIATKCVKGYGDGIRWAVSIFLHLLYMALIGPTMSIAITALVFSSFIHSSFVWDAQNRDRLGLGWRDAYRTLWLPTVIGIGIASIIVTQDGFTAFRLSMLALSLALGVPTAVLTASPYLSQITLRLRLFMIPEEFAVPPVLSSILAPEIHSLSLPKAKKI
ncbi:putative glycosyltransferase [Paraphoma chrysanthemicola]|uniref:Glucans biosynthesis glucosyltransferase H n=1 Tax=Paraphoma chrysanthemicola TaxID=798071 RepID=A0A8K0R8P4_9PLEO|nr:putative glycosyltransferase [Paraphoma chrysanthemicola]